jgi:DNA-binding PadR family transcriptional regulator
LALLVDDGPAHGFALAKKLGRSTDIGRVWAVPRPLVYRSLEQLEDRGFIRPGAELPGDAGPTRRPFTATNAGRRALRRWRRSPVDHLRDVRPVLILKLLLTVRADLDPGPLLRAQQQTFADTRPEVGSDASGPALVVEVWRDELRCAVDRTLARLSSLADPDDR